MTAGLARVLELPATAWLRRYRVRAKGRVMQPALDRLRAGITVAGVHYGPIEATLDREQGANVWLTIGIREGKNREVRKVLETLDLQVNRLIRVAFGPFELGDLEDGEVKEIESQALRTELGEKIVAEAGADFDAPLIDHDARPVPARHSGARPQGREPGIQRHDSQPPLDYGRPLRGSRNDKKKQPRRDRTGGPRPYPIRMIREHDKVNARSRRQIALAPDRRAEIGFAAPDRRPAARVAVQHPHSRLRRPGDRRARARFVCRHRRARHRGDLARRGLRAVRR